MQARMAEFAKLTPEQRREVGLDRETWQLEVVADPQSDVKIEHPLSKELGTALDWAALMALAEKHVVRYMKAATCLNVDRVFGMGLWEGVPLREVIWLTRPTANLRRVWYHGYHSDASKPGPGFQSSLSINRVLEDPPGEQPVILAYKMNGDWLAPKRGGPVRLVVPDGYGFKSIKWLQRVVLTNDPNPNDTYAFQNNDVDTPMKTFARFLNAPQKLKAGQPAALTGVTSVFTVVDAALWPGHAPLRIRHLDTDPARVAGGIGHRGNIDHPPLDRLIPGFREGHFDPGADLETASLAQRHRHIDPQGIVLHHTDHGNQRLHRFPRLDEPARDGPSLGGIPPSHQDDTVSDLDDHISGGKGVSLRHGLSVFAPDFRGVNVL